MPTIIVTGGCGYIGSHTAIELIEQGTYEVVSIDNLSNSEASTIDRIEAITGKRITNHNIDLCDLHALRKVFAQYEDVVGIIHFAALKAVGESVEKPLEYYHNNLNSLMNALQCCKEFSVPRFIFSSSCTVYGEIGPEKLPVTELTAVKPAESPYGQTKVMGERILEDFVKSFEGIDVIALRYFNPVGAHSSGLNGELPLSRPNNLVPVITQTAAGILPMTTVFGGDYPTRDGSCIRDYIHVSDIAVAHVLAMDYLMRGDNKKAFDMFNLGSGDGVTVLEAIDAFERVSEQKLNYRVGGRRPGDIVAIYSDSSKAKNELGWVPKAGIDEMMSSAWRWQQRLGGVVDKETA